MQNNNLTETQKQRNIVKDIVCSGGAVRTDQVRLQAFKLSVSCADTYLRMLARDSEIMRFWELDPKTGKHLHNTKHWSSVEYFEENVKPHLGVKYVQ